MPTQTKENYLKALYHLQQKNSEISVTELGKEMEVSKPTVNDMVKKLQQKGWVSYEKYKPIKLTEAGEKEACLIVRKHRLSEMFLNKVMGFGWEEVHDMAEEMEHLKSEVFFDRMDELLGFPNRDPHGSPIPDKNGNIASVQFVNMTSIDAGTKVIIKALRDSSLEFLNYLNKYDIKLGLEIEILSKEPFDKSCIVSYEGHKEQTLGHAVCNHLLVEVVNK